MNSNFTSIIDQARSESFNLLSCQIGNHIFLIRGDLFGFNLSSLSICSPLKLNDLLNSKNLSIRSVSSQYLFELQSQSQNEELLHFITLALQQASNRQRNHCFYDPKSKQ